MNTLFLETFQKLSNLGPTVPKEQKDRIAAGRLFEKVFGTSIFFNKQISKKKDLFVRGLKSGSIITDETGFKAVLPDWYARKLINQDFSQDTQKMMLQIIEERQAFYYLLNEMETDSRR